VTTPRGAGSERPCHTKARPSRAPAIRPCANDIGRDDSSLVTSRAYGIRAPHGSRAASVGVRPEEQMVRFVPPCRPLPRRPDGSFCTVCAAPTAVRCFPARKPFKRPLARADSPYGPLPQMDQSGALVKWSDTAPGDLPGGRSNFTARGAKSRSRPPKDGPRGQLRNHRNPQRKWPASGPMDDCRR
jgi:hypothetical protein